MVEIIALFVAVCIIGGAIYITTRKRPPVGGGVVLPDDPVKPFRPIDRR